MFLSRRFRINVQKIVRAEELIRKMRGGSQAHLIRTDDGGFCVVKFQNNPQHRRVLINESISTALLTHLQIETPAAVLVRIDKDFIHTHLELAIDLDSDVFLPSQACSLGLSTPAILQRSRSTTSSQNPFWRMSTTLLTSSACLSSTNGCVTWINGRRCLCETGGLTAPEIPKDFRIQGPDDRSRARILRGVLGIPERTRSGAVLTKSCVQKGNIV